ncbi:MAG: PIN domain-containing protein [Nodosilinea sp.]
MFDSDVLLDVLLSRQPFVVASTQALDLVPTQQVEGYLAGHAVTNIYYILRRQLGSRTAHEKLTSLLELVQVAQVTDQVIRTALQSPMADFEDAVTSAAANAINLELIVTRNRSDFALSLVPAIFPEDLVAMISD